MKLKIQDSFRTQPDPYIFEDNGNFYLYVTGKHAVEMYRAKNPFGEWDYCGGVCAVEGGTDYWAPCVIRTGGKYYMYFSYACPEQALCVAEADSPEGPFVFRKKLLNVFSIDAHAVENETGLYLFYAKDDRNGAVIGSKIFVDRLIDPYTLANEPVEVVTPSLDEEIFKRNRFGDGRDWYTVEGPFYFREGAYHYLIYSGGCFENESYHLGYAYAKDEGSDLTKLHFKKYSDEHGFTPLLFKNEQEEGTGHNSLLHYGGRYYIVYHGRDLGSVAEASGGMRTARICGLKIHDDVLEAERM